MEFTHEFSLRGTFRFLFSLPGGQLVFIFARPRPESSPVDFFSGFSLNLFESCAFVGSPTGLSIDQMAERFFEAENPC